MKISVKVRGDKEIDKKLKQLAKKNPEALKDVISKSVILIQGKAKDKAPVDTGRLQNSIVFEVKKTKKGYTGKVGTSLEYAPYVEMGTSRMNARPYLMPAMTESRSDIKRFLIAAIKGVKP